jgi:molecular chaperone DnaK
LNKKPITTINPDEAVALGAAIQGGVLSGAIKDVLLLDVAPLSLGIEVHGGIFSPVIARNSVVPVKKTEIFSTGVDNQTGIEIRVYQGERPFVDKNKLIGNFKLGGIPPLPKGVPQVEVTFDIDADGIMNVSAKEKTSGKETSITIINNTGLTEEEIDKMVKESEENKDLDIIKKNKLEGARNTELVLNDTEVGISAFQELFEKDEDYGKLTEKIKEIKEAIQIARNNGDITVPILRQLSKDLQDISVPIFQRVALIEKQKKSGK